MPILYFIWAARDRRPEDKTLRREPYQNAGERKGRVRSESPSLVS